MSKRLQVPISPGLDAQLENAAQRRRVSKSEWVRRALHEALRQIGMNEPKPHWPCCKVFANVVRVRVASDESPGGSEVSHRVLRHPNPSFRDEIVLDLLDITCRGSGWDAVSLRRGGLSEVSSRSMRPNTSSPSTNSPCLAASQPSSIFCRTSSLRRTKISSRCWSSRKASCTTSLADPYCPDFTLL